MISPTSWTRCSGSLAASPRRGLRRCRSTRTTSGKSADGSAARRRLSDASLCFARSSFRTTIPKRTRRFANRFARATGWRRQGTIARSSRCDSRAANAWRWRGRRTCGRTETESNSRCTMTPFCTIGMQRGSTTRWGMANKSTKVEILRRVEQVMKIILFGGEFSDIRQYSSEKDENTKRPRWGVCDRTLHTYQQQAYELIEQQVEKRRDRIFARHVQQRRQMLALAMEAGDLSTALQIVKDEAALHGIYPKTNVAVTLESV